MASTITLVNGKKLDLETACIYNCTANFYSGLASAPSSLNKISLTSVVGSPDVGENHDFICLQKGALNVNYLNASYNVVHVGGIIELSTEVGDTSFIDFCDFSSNKADTLFIIDIDKYSISGDHWIVAWNSQISVEGPVFKANKFELKNAIFDGNGQSKFGQVGKTSNVYFCNSNFSDTSGECTDLYTFTGLNTELCAIHTNTSKTVPLVTTEMTSESTCVETTSENVPTTQPRQDNTLILVIVLPVSGSLLLILILGIVLVRCKKSDVIDGFGEPLTTDSHTYV